MSILALLFSSAIAFAGSPPNDTYWLRLLHYKKSWLGHSRSLVDRKEFFFSPQGKHDPQAELAATVAALHLDPQVQCRFPERYRYLTSRGLIKTPVVLCQDFLDWKASLNARSVTLIFASAYAHKPASLFGHTFLRFNSASGQTIRDYGANFAAVTGDENILAYVYKGILGGFSGAFSVTPYYIKLNEYIFAENRDIWEYDLDINQEQIDRMLGHLWELLVNSSFNYFYFDENCSYKILSLLEVARPDWQLTDFAGYVLPLETLRTVVNAHAVSDVRFRPSARNNLLARLTDLNPRQTQNFRQVIRNPQFDQSGMDAPTLDAAAAYMFYRKQTENGSLSKAGDEHLHRILVTRSLINERSVALPTPAPSDAPELSHLPYRLGFKYGALGEQTFEEVSWRLGVHDFLNLPQGYSEYSQFEVIDFHFRHWNDSNKTKLQEFRLFRATSVFPLTFLDHKPSYELDLGCINECENWRAMGGMGLATHLGTSRVIAWSMARGELESYPSRGGVSISANILSRLWTRDRTLIEFKHRKWFSPGPEDNELKVTHAHSLSERHELRAGLKWSSLESNECTLEWNWFF